MQIAKVLAFSPDPARLRRFYQDGLELPCQEQGDGFRVHIGSSTLQIQKGERPPYHLALNVPPLQLDEAARWVGGAAALLRDSQGQELFEFESWQARSIYFQDPDGNILECIARRRIAPGRCQPFQPLNLSEVGIAVDDVEESARRLGERLRLAVFFGADNPQFRALGDDEGLLILVQRGRVWYPETGIPAENAGLEIHLSSGEWIGPDLKIHS